MIDPYIAVALQTTVRHCATRSETERNLVHIGNMLDLVCHICSLELPVRLVALGEGCIQGFADEILHLSSAEYYGNDGRGNSRRGNRVSRRQSPSARHLHPRADQGESCRNTRIDSSIPSSCSILAARSSTSTARTWFCSSSIPPLRTTSMTSGYRKTATRLDAFFPVAKTEIGNIAGSVGVEGSFPESYRGFALNGAEDSLPGFVAGTLGVARDLGCTEPRPSS